MANESRVAVITGGASGMGLAMAERLASNGWRVALIDINDRSGHATEEKFGGEVSYFRADVSDYDAQVAAFEAIWSKWNRIDVVWANAGIGDRVPFMNPPTEVAKGGPPPKPDVLVIDVDLYGTVYSSYLALFYFRKNKVPGGKLIMTSSTAGLYPNIALPLYGAAKHGVCPPELRCKDEVLITRIQVVGLARNMALILAANKEPIHVSCLCPGLVKTALPAQELFDIFPAEHLTPMDTIIRCVEDFIGKDSNGRVVECSGPNLNEIFQADYSDEHSRFLVSAFVALDELRYVSTNMCVPSRTTPFLSICHSWLRMRWINTPSTI
jgi:15-hydroxyprostaglandin dehydrogenase (NAD)